MSRSFTVLPRTLVHVAMGLILSLSLSLSLSLLASLNANPFAPSQALAADAQESNFNVALVIDGSGSLNADMVGTTVATDPYNLRYDALSLFLALLTDSGNYVDAVVFNDSPSFLLNTGVQPINGRDAKNGLIDQIRAAGAVSDTDIGSALLEAVDALEAAAEQNGLPSVVILFSDGRTDLGGDETRYQQSLANKQSAIELAQQASIPVYSICLQASDVADPDELRQISDATGGDFIAVTDASGLVNAFESFYSLIFPSSSAERVEKSYDETGTADYGFSVPSYGVREVNVIVDDTNTQSMTLLSPQGELSAEEIDASTMAGGQYRVVKLVNPSTGDWNLHLSGTPGAGVTINVIYNVETDVSLRADGDVSRIELGDCVTMSACMLLDGEPIDDSVINDEFATTLIVTERASGQETRLPMASADTGVFTCSFAPEAEGTYDLCAEMAGGGVTVVSGPLACTVVQTSATIATEEGDTQFELGNTAKVSASLMQSGELAPIEVSDTFSATLFVRDTATGVSESAEMKRGDASTYTFDLGFNDAATYEVYAELTDGARTYQTSTLELSFVSTLAKIATDSGETSFMTGADQRVEVTVTQDGEPIDDAFARSLVATAHVVNEQTGEETQPTTTYEGDGVYSFALDGSAPADYLVSASFEGADLSFASSDLEVSFTKLEAVLSIEGDSLTYELGQRAGVDVALMVNGEPASDEQAAGYVGQIDVSTVDGGASDSDAMSYAGNGVFHYDLGLNEPADVEVSACLTSGQLGVQTDTQSLSFVHTQVELSTDAKDGVFDAGEAVAVKARLTRNSEPLGDGLVSSCTGRLHTVNATTGAEDIVNLSYEGDGVYACTLQPDQPSSMNVFAVFDVAGATYMSDTVALEAVSYDAALTVPDNADEFRIDGAGATLSLRVSKNSEALVGSDLNACTATLYLTDEASGQTVTSELSPNADASGWDIPLESDVPVRYSAYAVVSVGQREVQTPTVEVMFVDRAPDVVGATQVEMSTVVLPFAPAAAHVDLAEHFAVPGDDELTYQAQGFAEDGSDASNRVSLSGSELSVDMSSASPCSVVASASNPRGLASEVTFNMRAFDTRPIFAVLGAAIVLLVVALLLARHHKATHVHYEGLVSVRSLSDGVSGSKNPGKIVTGRMALSAFGVSRDCGFDLGKAYVMATGARSLVFGCNREFFTRSGKQKGTVLLQVGDNAIYTDETRKSGVVVNVSTDARRMAVPRTAPGARTTQPGGPQRREGPAVRSRPAARR